MLFQLRYVSRKILFNKLDFTSQFVSVVNRIIKPAEFAVLDSDAFREKVR